MCSFLHTTTWNEGYECRVFGFLDFSATADEPHLVSRPRMFHQPSIAPVQGGLNKHSTASSERRRPPIVIPTLVRETVLLEN